MAPVSAESWRLFIALPVPFEAARRIQDQLRPFVARFPAARWSRPELYHVTLRFLGVTPSMDVARIAATLDHAVREIPAFRVTVTQGGGLRRRGGGVGWLSLGDDASTVRLLSDRIGLALGDGRPSSAPHLTVVRRAPSALIDALAVLGDGALGVDWTADRAVLFRSHTGTPAGSSYEALAEVPL